MALKPASVARAPRDDEFEEVPEGIPRHGNPDDARPKIRHPQPCPSCGVDNCGRSSFYTRASKFGKPIEDSFLIHRAEQRRLVYGLSRRDDLVMAAQAVPGLDERADKDELWRIARSAIEAGGGSLATGRGTALHKLRERRDRGEDLAFVGPKTYAALEAWSHIADRFTWHGSEQFVVHDTWRAAGTYDALWSPRNVMIAPDGARITPGDLVIADLKSGRWGAGRWGPTYNVQLCTYGKGRPYVHVTDEQAAAGDDGRRPWSPGVPRQDWALIPHVPIESPEDAGLVWVNLKTADVLGNLADAIVKARRLDDLFGPAELPAAELTELDILRLIRATSDQAGLEQLWTDSHAAWTPLCKAKATAKLDELGAVG